MYWMMIRVKLFHRCSSDNSYLLIRDQISLRHSISFSDRVGDWSLPRPLITPDTFTWIDADGSEKEEIGVEMMMLKRRRIKIKFWALYVTHETDIWGVGPITSMHCPSFDQQHISTQGVESTLLPKEGKESGWRPIFNQILRLAASAKKAFMRGHKTAFTAGHWGAADVIKLLIWPFFLDFITRLATRQG